MQGELFVNINLNLQVKIISIFTIFSLFFCLFWVSCKEEPKIDNKGTVVFSTGKTFKVKAGQKQPLKIRDNIAEGDNIKTKEKFCAEEALIT